MSFNPSRLYSTLLNTGLQTKDNPLYQVLHDLIAAVASVNKQTDTIISGGSSPQIIIDLPTSPIIFDDSSFDNNDIIRLNPAIQDLISNFIQGSVIFAGPSGYFAQDNINLFWDNINKRLGLGTKTPENLLEVVGGGIRIQGEVNSPVTGKGLELRFNSFNSGVIQTFNRLTSTWLNTSIQGASVDLTANDPTAGNITLNPSGIGHVFCNVLTGGSNVNQALIFISTSGVGVADSISFRVGTNGGTIALTINHDGTAAFGFDLQAQTFTTTGRIWSTGYIRAGAADSTSPIAGDIVANRGGNPGSGVVFFGGSANAHYLYYDGSKFNLTDPFTSIFVDTITIANLTSGKIPIATTNGKLIDSTPSLQVAAGSPVIVASTFEKAETGSDANVLTYTPGGTDEFLVVQIATDVSAITGTSVAVTVTWKDSNNATATSTLTISAIGDGTINIPINAKASNNVVISTVFVGVSTAYKISAFVTRLK